MTSVLLSRFSGVSSLLRRVYDTCGIWSQKGASYEVKEKDKEEDHV